MTQQFVTVVNSLIHSCKAHQRVGEVMILSRPYEWMHSLALILKNVLVSFVQFSLCCALRVVCGVR